MIQALFDNEIKAFEGLQALKQLDFTKDIAMGESYVLSKDNAGRTAIRSANNESEGVGTIGGGLIGGLVGLLAGPLGFIVGVAGGMIAGSAGETLKAEGMSDYLDGVAANIPNGKSVLIAHVWEDWEAPVDSALYALSADVRRFNVNEQVYTPAQTELGKLNADIKVAETRLAESTPEERAEWEATLADLNHKRQILQVKLNTQTDYREKQYQSWVDEHPDTETVHDVERRKLLENRIDEQKRRLEQLRKNR